MTEPPLTFAGFSSLNVRICSFYSSFIVNKMSLSLYFVDEWRIHWKWSSEKHKVEHGSVTLESTLICSQYQFCFLRLIVWVSKTRAVCVCVCVGEGAMSFLFPAVKGSLDPSEAHLDFSLHLLMHNNINNGGLVPTRSTCYLNSLDVSRGCPVLWVPADTVTNIGWTDTRIVQNILENDTKHWDFVEDIQKHQKMSTIGGK